MSLSTFDDLLASARAQDQPQRLLFVFVAAGVPDDATPEQRARFEAGQGGTLTPLMHVDKTPAELLSFAGLAEESAAFGAPWDIVFVAAMAGKDQVGPTPLDAEAPLLRMVESIKSGRIGGFAAFDVNGQPVNFS